MDIAALNKVLDLIVSADKAEKLEKNEQISFIHACYRVELKEIKDLLLKDK
jgi:hypothetical protein